MADDTDLITCPVHLSGISGRLCTMTSMHRDKECIHYGFSCGTTVEKSDPLICVGDLVRWNKEIWVVALVYTDAQGDWGVIENVEAEDDVLLSHLEYIGKDKLSTLSERKKGLVGADGRPLSTVTPIEQARESGNLFWGKSKAPRDDEFTEEELERAARIRREEKLRGFRGGSTPSYPSAGYGGAGRYDSGRRWWESDPVGETRPIKPLKPRPKDSISTGSLIEKEVKRLKEDGSVDDSEEPQSDATDEPIVPTRKGEW